MGVKHLKNLSSELRKWRIKNKLETGVHEKYYMV